jgi:hypothetical protein
MDFLSPGAPKSWKTMIRGSQIIENDNPELPNLGNPWSEAPE